MREKEGEMEIDLRSNQQHREKKTELNKKENWTDIWKEKMLNCRRREVKMIKKKLGVK